MREWIVAGIGVGLFAMWTMPQWMGLSRKTVLPQNNDPVLPQIPISQHRYEGVPDGTQTWEVVRVSNGDTIRARRGGQEERIQLACIDAPEGNQPLGDESGQRLRQMLDQAGGQVELLVTDRDRYDRLIAEVYAGEQFVQSELVREGLAWSYRRYHYNCPSADLINQVEAEAKAAGVGVFSGGHIEPWEWRQ